MKVQIKMLVLALSTTMALFNASSLVQAESSGAGQLTAPIESVLGAINAEGWQGSAVSTTAEPDPDKLAITAEYGCQNRIAKSFQRGQRRIDVVVYSFITPAGAYGAYNFYRNSATNPVVKGDASSEDDHSIAVWKDRYFITVIGTAQDDDESKALVTSICDKVVAAIPGHSELPTDITRLPMMDRVKGSEKIVMGPLTARRLFPAPSMALLSIDTAKGAAIADYQTSVPYHERMKLLVITYSEPSVAAKAYYKYVQEIQKEHPSQGPSSESSAFKLANSFLICELHDNHVVIVSGARKRQAASLLAHQVL